MKCPSCGKNVQENASYCNSCGAALFGPRSIDLNDLGGGKNTFQSNNITSITGIDINDITPVQNKKVEKPIKPRENNVKIPKDLPSKDVNIGTIILLLVIASLLALSIYLFLENRKLKKVETPPLVTPPVVVDCVKGYYGLTNAYSFLLPNNWIYSQTASEVVLTNEKVSMLIFNYVKGKVDHITSDKLKNEYINQGYAIVTVEENTLNSKKIMYVKYSANNINFVDFYYQYDSEKIIYGQASSVAGEVLTEDVRNIIASVTIQTRNNNITIGKAPVSYQNILTLMN